MDRGRTLVMLIRGLGRFERVLFRRSRWLAEYLINPGTGRGLVRLWLILVPVMCIESPLGFVVVISVESCWQL